MSTDWDKCCIQSNTQPEFRFSDRNLTRIGTLTDVWPQLFCLGKALIYAAVTAEILA